MGDKSPKAKNKAKKQNTNDKSAKSKATAANLVASAAARTEKKGK